MNGTATGSTPSLNGSVPLIAAYRLLVCDLDGVVYRGPNVVPHAAAALTAARAAGVAVVYATNNASRPPDDVARHLCDLGIDASPHDVLTSSQAAAAHLAGVLPAGSPVLAVGGPGVAAALVEAGLTAIDPATRRANPQTTPAPVAVAQGFGRNVGWEDLADAAELVRNGALWVATNTDSTQPSERGILPGNGTLVDAVRHAVDSTPHVVGKPQPPLYTLAMNRQHASSTAALGIGDRVDTDIAGAAAARIASLCVLTGVETPTSLALLPSEAPAPTYICHDLRGLHQPYDHAVTTDDGAVCGDARVDIAPDGPRLRLHDQGTPDQRVRALVAACREARRHGIDAAAALPPGADVWVADGHRTP